MDNKLAIHYGSFVKNWADDQLALIKRVKSLGFDMLEFGAIYLKNMSDDEIKRFKDEAEKQGVVLCLSLGLAPAEDIGSPDAGMREVGKTILKDVAVAMNKAGISDCSGIIHSSWNGKSSADDEKKM